MLVYVIGLKHAYVDVVLDLASHFITCLWCCASFYCTLPSHDVGENSCSNRACNMMASPAQRAASPATSQGETSGTTLTFVVIDGWTVTVASVGDSRCILDSQDGVVTLLTIDHKLEDNIEEGERVTTSGGEVGRLNLCGGHELSTKEHQKFQSSYATILKAHMTSLKKRTRKEKRAHANSSAE